MPPFALFSGIRGEGWTLSRRLRLCRPLQALESSAVSPPSLTLLPSSRGLWRPRHHFSPPCPFSTDDSPVYSPQPSLPPLILLLLLLLPFDEEREDVEEGEDPCRGERDNREDGDDVYSDDDGDDDGENGDDKCDDTEEAVKESESALS